MNKIIEDMIIPHVPSEYSDVVKSIISKVRGASLSSFESETSSHIILLGELKDNISLTIADGDFFLSNIKFGGKNFIVIHMVISLDNGDSIDNIGKQS